MRWLALLTVVAGTLTACDRCAPPDTGPPPLPALPEGAHVLLYDALALRDGTEWVVTLRGRVYRAGDGALTEAVARELAAQGLKVSEPDRERRLAPRLARLRARGVEGVELALRLADQQLRVTSGADGYFTHEARLPEGDVLTSLAGGLLIARVELPPGDGRVYSGRVLIERRQPGEREGVLVCDLDGALRQVGRTDAEWLAATMTEELSLVPEMAELMRRLRRIASRSHIVGGVPEALHQPLDHLLNAAGVPPTRRLDLRPTPAGQPVDDAAALVRGLRDEAESQARLRRAVELHEGPVFLLGDTSNGLPEVFAELWRRYPRRVQLVLMRNTTGATEAALESVFEGLPRQRWRLFSDPRQLRE